MKKRNAINDNVLTILLGIVFITGLLSCTGNSNSTDVKNNDSTNMKDNTMTTTSDANESGKMMTDSADANNNKGNNNNTAADAAFMMKVAEINMEEIKLGKLAQQKSTVSHVKELGKMMATEHTKAMTDLITLAKTKLVTLPGAESEKIMDAYKMLSEKKGKDFDKAYSDMMVKGHKDAIDLFEKTNRDTKDADVKAMTTAMIPKLKTHLQHAEMCQKECEKM